MQCWADIYASAVSRIKIHRVLAKNKAENVFNSYLMKYPDLKKLYDERRLLVLEIAKENMVNLTQENAFDKIYIELRMI